MPPEDNKFIDNLYHEFEQKLFKVFGFGIEDLEKVLDRADTDERPGHCLDRGGERQQDKSRSTCKKFMSFTGHLGCKHNQRN